MKKVILPVILILIITGVFMFLPKKAGGPTQKELKNNEKNEEKKVSDLQFPGILPAEKIANKKVSIKTEKGIIEVELFSDEAPKSVSNFIYLIEDKFYDGLTFHRVVPEFVIQGGDPSGNGTGGPGYQWDDEPVVGEYKEGALAMANAGPNTNGSQFFICLTDQPNLPKNYNLFGQVVSGLEIVKKIEIGDRIEEITVSDK